MTLGTSRAWSSEWRILLACAAPVAEPDPIHKRIDGAIDWDGLLSLAELHGLLPLLAQRVENCETLSPLISAGFRQRLREKRCAQILSNLSMMAELFRLSDRFEKAGIETVAVKGPTLAAQAFGDTSLRQYSDLDFVVRHEAVLRAMQVMGSAGFVTEIPPHMAAAGRVPGQFLFVSRERNLIVELHTERTLRYFPRPLPLNDFFARRVRIPLEGREVAAFSAEDTLSFICVHGSKHLWERLMWVADVAALVSRPGSFGWYRALATAKETGSECMVHLGLRLAMDALKTPLPKEIREAVVADNTARKLAGEVLEQFTAGEQAMRSLLARALFRARMCGGFLRGPAYLLRLSLAPTEEDWIDARAAGWLEALRRPLRLARKYRRVREKSVPGADEVETESKKARA